MIYRLGLFHPAFLMLFTGACQQLALLVGFICYHKRVVKACEGMFRKLCIVNLALALFNIILPFSPLIFFIIVWLTFDIMRWEPFGPLIHARLFFDVFYRSQKSAVIRFLSLPTPLS
jgi:hypothetical protein